MKKLLLLLTLCASAFSQVAPFINPHAQFFDGNGKPLSGGKLYACVSGTSCPGNPQATFTDSTGSVQNPNPIILDSSGSANIWLSASPYKFVLQNSAGVQIWTVDVVQPPCSPNQACSWSQLQTFLAGIAVTGNSSITGNLSVTGSITANSLETVRYCGQFTGSDWAAKCNSADGDITLSGASCGIIVVESTTAGNATTNFSPSPCRSVVWMPGSWTLTGASIVLGSGAKISLHGSGEGVTTLVQGTAGTNLITSSASTDVDISGFTFSGSSGAASSGNSAVFPTSTTQGNLARWNVHNNRFTGWRWNAVYMQNVDDSFIKDNMFDNGSSSCIRGSGLRRFEWSGNICRDPFSTTFNIGYMIDSTDPIGGVVYPVSFDGNIHDNKSINLVNWYGFELHSGQKITLADNECDNCMGGTIVSPFNGTDTTGDVAINGFRYVGQTTQDTTCTDGNQGISVAGGGVGIATPTTISITGGTIRNANAALRSFTEGGITIGTTTNTTVKGVTIVGGYGAGIIIAGTTNPATSLDIDGVQVSGVQVAQNTSGYCGDGATAAGVYVIGGAVAPTGWIKGVHVDSTPWGIRSDVAASGMLVGINYFTSVTTPYPGSTLTNLSFDVLGHSNLPLGLALNPASAPDTCFTRAAAGQFNFGNCTTGDQSGLIYANRFRVPSILRIESGLVRLGSTGAWAWASTADGENGTTDTSVTRPNAKEIQVGNADASGQIDFTTGQLQGTAFASLGAPGNGTFKYCNDCTIANPCAGGGTGALAKRLNGAWVCN